MSLPRGVPAATAPKTLKGLPGCLIALIIAGGIMAVVFIALVVFFLSKGGKLRGQQAASMASDTMCPTICENESVTVDPNAYLFEPPRRGSLILFFRPSDKLEDIRRVVGLPGDTVSSDENGDVLVNGDPVRFPAVCGSPVRRQVRGQKEQFEPVTVPPGEFFVIGDNLDISYDSRDENYGTVKKEAIIGQPAIIYMSPGKGRFGCVVH